MTFHKSPKFYFSCARRIFYIFTLQRTFKQMSSFLLRVKDKVCKLKRYSQSTFSSEDVLSIQPMEKLPFIYVDTKASIFIFSYTCLRLLLDAQLRGRLCRIVTSSTRTVSHLAYLYQLYFCTQ